MSCMPTSARLGTLKGHLEQMKKEAETAISNVRSIMLRGYSIFASQKSIQDAECFLNNFPTTDSELCLLINKIVKFNCEFEILLAKTSAISDVTDGFENDDSVLFEGDPWSSQSISLCNVCSKEKRTVGVCTETAPLNEINEYQVTEICRLYDIEKESILEMKYLLGENPSEFWLGFYSDSELQSHLATIKKQIQAGELHCLSETPRIGQYIIGCVDTVFRGCVLATSNKNIVAVDIDRGELKVINEHNSWEIGDFLSHFPPQALLCKLSSMKHGVEWYSCLSNMFRNCLKKCNLVVTIKEIIPGLIPVFVVDVDAHDNIILDLNFNQWLNSYVFPAIEKVELNGSSDNVNENSFQNINPFVLCKEDTASNSVYSSKSELCSEEEDENSVENGSETVDKRAAVFNSIEINLEKSSTKNADEIVSNITCVNREDIEMNKINGSSSVSVESNPQILENKKINQFSSEVFREPSSQEQFSKAVTEMESQQSGPLLEFTSVKCCMDKGTTTEMSFLYGNDPWNFTLHYISKEEYNQLKTYIKKKAEKNELKRFKNVPKVGNFAIGKHDLDYCRVYITDISQNSEEVVVIDIDNGEIKLLSLSELWELDQSFSVLPSMAVCCSLWNIIRHPFYWNVDLENLFKKLLSKGPLKVCIKDIKFDSGYWKHIVQIQTMHECVIDVSEWIMFHVFPNLQEIQFSGKTVSDLVSKIDPFEVYNERSPTCITSSHHVNSDIKSCDRNTALIEICNKGFSTRTNILSDVKLGSDKHADYSQESQKNNNCYNCARENYKNKETYSMFCSKVHNNSSLDYKKCTMDVTPGTKYFVFLAGILKPSEFYIHIVSIENSVMDEMQKELQHYCSSESICFQSKKEAKQLILNCCAVNFENQWYRGRIISWLEESSDDVFAFLVDFGIYTVATFKSVQCLRSDFYRYPPFAQRCSLAYISPPNGSSEWPRESLEGFWKILDFDIVYEVCVESYLESDDTLNVFLSCGESQHTYCINDLLIERSFAVENSKIIVTKSKNFHSVVYPIVDTAENLSDDEWNDGDDNQCSMEIVTYFDNNTMGLPRVGERLQIVITEIVNLHSFYGVPTEVKHGGKQCKTHYSLMEMNKMMTSAAESGQLKRSKYLMEGAIVIARFSTDRMWYRARILSALDDYGYVDVYFVDYGNVDHVHKQYIKEISKEFCSLPFQAMRFFIEGIDITKLTEEYARKKARAVLNDLTGKSNVFVQVVSETNEDVMVHVFSDGIDIAAMLLSVYHEQCMETESNKVSSK